MFTAKVALCLWAASLALSPSTAAALSVEDRVHRYTHGEGNGGSGGTLWPISAFRTGLVFSTPADEPSETNGDRLKRGLPPLPPRRLFTPSRTQALKPRMSPAPNQAGGGLDFLLCVTTPEISGYGYQGATYGSNQEAVDACSDALPNVEFLAVRQTGPHTYDCVDSPEGDGEEDCTPTDWAVYGD